MSTTTINAMARTKNFFLDFWQNHSNEKDFDAVYQNLQTLFSINKPSSFIDKAEMYGLKVFRPKNMENLSLGNVNKGNIIAWENNNSQGFIGLITKTPKTVTDKVNVVVWGQEKTEKRSFSLSELLQPPLPIPKLQMKGILSFQELLQKRTFLEDEAEMKAVLAYYNQEMQDSFVQLWTSSNTQGSIKEHAFHIWTSQSAELTNTNFLEKILSTSVLAGGIYTSNANDHVTMKFDELNEADDSGTFVLGNTANLLYLGMVHSHPYENMTENTPFSPGDIASFIRAAQFYGTQFNEKERGKYFTFWVESYTKRYVLVMKDLPKAIQAKNQAIETAKAVLTNTGQSDSTYFRAILERWFYTEFGMSGNPTEEDVISGLNYVFNKLNPLGFGIELYEILKLDGKCNKLYSK